MKLTIRRFLWSTYNFDVGESIAKCGFVIFIECNTFGIVLPVTRELNHIENMVLWKTIAKAEHKSPCCGT